MLIGDEKNLEMPYTKEATLRIQQERFKRFLKLIEVAVVHSKINLMEQNTKNFVTRIKEENQSYQEYLQQAKISKERDMHFKGKQYLQCLFQL